MNGPYRGIVSIVHLYLKINVIFSLLNDVTAADVVPCGGHTVLPYVIHSGD